MIKIMTFQDEIVIKKVAHLKVSIFPYGQDGLKKHLKKRN
jgi:hypothetical protein